MVKGIVCQIVVKVHFSVYITQLVLKPINLNKKKIGRYSLIFVENKFTFYKFSDILYFYKSSIRLLIKTNNW